MPQYFARLDRLARQAARAFPEGLEPRVIAVVRAFGTGVETGFESEIQFDGWIKSVTQDLSLSELVGPDDVPLFVPAVLLQFAEASKGEISEQYRETLVVNTWCEATRIFGSKKDQKKRKGWWVRPERTVPSPRKPRPKPVWWPKKPTKLPPLAFRKLVEIEWLEQ